jgi:thioredoxin reductase (NADPH)
MKDLIIIGGGPAGFAAAIYALGKQLDVTIIYEQAGGKTGWRQRLTGQLADEFLAGEEAVHTFERRIETSGRALHDRVRNVAKIGDVFRVTTENHDVLESAAVIVATGASPIGLMVPGAKEFLGQGLGYSITTHANLAAGKTAGVIGATLRALRGTAELAQTAREVYFIAPDASILSTPLAQALHSYENVRIIAGARVKEVAGSFNVEELVIEHNGQARRLGVDLAFIDLGLHANSGLVRGLLEIDPGQFIPIDERNATPVDGLFAAGDVTTAFGEQTLIAIGEGAKAALSAYDHLLARKTLRARETT